MFQPATPKQIDFINTLRAERDLTPEHAERLTTAVTAGMTKATASATISWLMKQPARQQAAAAPAEEGFYVKDGEAYKVQWNKARTGTYALRYTPQQGSRPTWEYAPGVGKSLAAEGLVPMTAEDAARIGLAHGYCINCSRELGGKTLSAQVSAVIGYGEVCAGHNGWPYPKGAKAQRAFIAERAAAKDAEAQARTNEVVHMGLDLTNECSGGVCKDIYTLCSRHQMQYQTRYGRASNE